MEQKRNQRYAVGELVQNNAQGNIEAGKRACFKADGDIETVKHRVHRKGGQSEGAPAGAFAGHANGGGLPADRGMLWTVDQDGRLEVLMVRTGITDGTSTEVGGPQVTAGRSVIAGKTSAAAAVTASPFQQQAPAAGPPRPGGF